MGLKDCDVTQLVAAGVLTVRDAGSWWLALPGAGRFIRALLHGRKQLLAAVRRSRHREVLQAELGQRRARPSLGLRYVLLDLLGAELLRSVPTTSGPLLRLAET
ncbi:serine/threonine-protein kinase 19 isoform X1 [Meleagris gallopavo]|nr:serine/threonine-protein kinase 19 isoform X1 [Meleagris gallopavo]